MQGRVHLIGCSVHLMLGFAGLMPGRALGKLQRTLDAGQRTLDTSYFALAHFSGLPMCQAKVLST